MAVERTRDKRCDVLIVGGGTAAFEAALASRDAGAENVVMLDKASADEAGGNARFSHTGFRFAHSGPSEIREFLPDVDEALFRRMEILPYSEREYMDDLLQVTGGRINRDLAETLVSQSNSAVHWMLDMGIKWEPDDEIWVKVGDRIHFPPGLVINPVGGGTGQVRQWQALAEKWGVHTFFDSPVSALLGDSQAVEGVRVSGPEGACEVYAPCIILCAGGFQANPEMRARYLGPNADLMKVRGHRHDTGEVLQMALGLGAKAAGHWQHAHATPIDASAPEVEGGNTYNRYQYPFGITVNREGRRFFDEGEGDHSYTYAKTGWAVLRQPVGAAHQIFDQKVVGLLGKRYRGRDHVEAQTLDELAGKLGIDAAALRSTIEEFNRAVVADVPFNPGVYDHKHTQGLAVPKSNWALPIDAPPFVAYEVTGGITFSFGGLEIDTAARVLNTRGVPIRGLYATGDIVGLFFHNYPSMSGQVRNVVFALLAALDGVSHATRP